MTYNLIFTRRFSMGHRLISGTSKKCSLPHGHNEIVRVFLKANEPAMMDGMHNVVAIFEKAKKRWHDFIDACVDHSFHLSCHDDLVVYFQEKEPDLVPRLLITPGDPTTEILCACLMNKLQIFLDDDNVGLHCTQIQIEETPTNKVLLEGAFAYKKVLPKTHLDTAPPWWNRPDRTINDLS